MDSLTQAVLGACVAAITAPPQHRRAALLAGAGLATLPDLDVLPLAFVDDAIRRMTWHRSASHSLVVLAPFSLLVWLWLRRVWTPVREAPRRWLAAIALALITHPLLDAHTVYGTELWWPLPLDNAMWSTIFIIDPLYTVPLLVAAICAWFLRARRGARMALVVGLGLSSAYLGWSWIAKSLVEARAQHALAAMGLESAPRFSVPTSFNTWVWRVVALTPDGMVEGYTAVLGEDGPMHFERHERGVESQQQALLSLESVARLRRFAHGFIDLSERDGDLVLSDLRMGAHPYYFFRFAVAKREGEGWRAIVPRTLPRPDMSQRRAAEAARGR